jgi:hypothetical protein
MTPRLDQQLHQFAGFDGVPSEERQHHMQTQALVALPTAA